MPMQCVLCGINRRIDTVHSFPKDKAARGKWIEVCCLRKEVADTDGVCTHHFTEDDYSGCGIERRVLKRSAVPSLNLPAAVTGPVPASREVSGDSMDPYERARLVQQAMMEYEQRKDKAANNWITDSGRDSPPSGDAVTQLFPSKERLSDRLARLKQGQPLEDPPSPPRLVGHQRRRGRPSARARRGPARGGGRPSPKTAASGHELVAATELPEGLLAAVPRPRGQARGRGRGRGRGLKGSPAARRGASPPAREEDGRGRSPRGRRRGSGREAVRSSPRVQLKQEKDVKKEEVTIEETEEEGGSSTSEMDSDTDLDDTPPAGAGADVDMDMGGHGDGAEVEVVSSHSVLHRAPDADGDRLSSSLSDSDSSGDERDDTMVTVFPCVQVVHEDGAESCGDGSSSPRPTTVVLDALPSSGSNSSSDCDLCPSPPPLPSLSLPAPLPLGAPLTGSRTPVGLRPQVRIQVLPRRPPPLLQARPVPPPGTKPQRTIVVRRPDGGLAAAPIVRMVPDRCARTVTVADPARRVIFVNPFRPPRLQPQPPPSAAVAQEVPVLDVSDSVSDADSAAGDDDGDMISCLDDSERRELTVQLLEARTRLAQEEYLLRAERARLTQADAGAWPDAESDDRYPVPASPPRLPRVSAPGPVRGGRAALRSLQRRHWQLYRAALQSALQLRQAQRAAVAARLHAYSERRRLQGFLSAAQWRALRDGREPSTWSVHDLTRAVQLRGACGEEGYQFLRERWHMPLPELGTLPDQVAPPSPPAVAQVAPPSPPAVTVGRRSAAAREARRLVPSSPGPKGTQNSLRSSRLRARVKD